MSMTEHELAVLRLHARVCTTHHEACDCRELAHYEQVERLRAELDMKGGAWTQSADIFLDERTRLHAENADLLDKNAKMATEMLAVSKELLTVQGPRVARLEAENAALRQIAQAVAAMDMVSDESRRISGLPGFGRYADLIAKARALLAKE